MARQLEGSIALITGAGAGLGQCTAQTFAARGAALWITDLDLDAAQATCAGLPGEGHTACRLDVTDGDEVRAVFAQVARDAGRLDVIVNNAGLNVRDDFRHLSDEGWERIRSVNLDGVVRIARDGFEMLRAGGKVRPTGASLVNMASITAARGGRQFVGYATTKGAVVSLTRGLAAEYASFNIRVNCLTPGFFDTALTRRIMRQPALKQALVERIPMGRLGALEDVAKAAAFLASEDAEYISGAELAVDGGMAAAL